MLLTVTANTTMDQTLVVPHLTPNKTIRATQTIQSMGGKPTDCSWILGRKGVPSLALGFSAGIIGERIEGMLSQHGVSSDFIAVDGQSRLNTVIIGENDHTHTTITTATLDVTEAHIAALREKYIAKLHEASCVVLGGTLPKNMSPEFYTDMIALATERNIPVIFDADEPNLGAGLQSSPTYAKPNEHELEHLTGKVVDSLAVAYKIGRDIYEQYGTCPIITLGERGALAILPDKAYFIPPLEVNVVSPAGAGDGVLAGLALSILQGQPVEEGLRMGIAFATAILLQLGTAMYTVEEYERLLPKVELQLYTPSEQ